MLDMTIGGQSVPAADGRFEVRNPATGEVVDTAPNATEADLDRAVSSAREAADAWSRKSDEELAAACRAVAETITANAEELAQLLTREQGKPLNGLGAPLGARRRRRLGRLHRQSFAAAAGPAGHERGQGRAHPQAARRRRLDHPLELPGDDRRLARTCRRFGPAIPS